MAEHGLLIIGSLTLLVVLLTSLWSFEIGRWRALGAGCARVLWILPLALAFFPQLTTEKKPRTMSTQTLHLLIDDSDSMKDSGTGTPPFERAKQLRTEIDKACLNYGCITEVTNLSQLSQGNLDGFTPLSDKLATWLFRVGRDPWVLMSDGGDWKPSIPWTSELRNAGKMTANDDGKVRGAIVNLNASSNYNVWISHVDAPPLSFETKPFVVHVNLERSKGVEENAARRVQVQVLIKDKILGTENAVFQQNLDATDVAITIPPLNRGQHLIIVRALPVPLEQAVWDNESSFEVEVLPNTIGILHLLGAPSWDGRFLRRFLKGEPKYDLISFYILRDRWDSQLVSERELSLIPFPVERLMKEELPNFRVIVIQNFALFEFLLTEYQENLVQFVNNGGGLLFIGGPRALQVGDISGSAFANILPFNVDLPATLTIGNMPFANPYARRNREQVGPYYDLEQKFRIKFANPLEKQRALANVFEDWSRIGKELTAFEQGTGLHALENVQFKEGEYTPLLFAEMDSGKQVPLAVANYPGKGRALWVFTDSLWRLAFSNDGQLSRSTYQRFFESAMNWLLRQETNKPLVARNLQLSPRPDGRLDWKMLLRGPAVSFFQTDSAWSVSICGVQSDRQAMVIEQLSADDWFVSGTVKTSIKGGEVCEAEVSGVHSAFGSIKARSGALVPRIYRDDEIGGSNTKLARLASLTNARLINEGENYETALINWLENMRLDQGVILPDDYRSSQDFFWVLDRWYIWLLLLGLPLEVVIRRWHLLFSRVKEQKQVSSQIGLRSFAAAQDDVGSRHSEEA